ncbi:MAG: ACP S-malonyltransferase [Candidatus Hydrogenedentes bacterium]|jgi:[acyl-carrier-protein] S-malonyltransferase|nr:ACP S-malonyltransferase [Candidatus Hydrogenedentota bacterium]
MSFFLFPGQGSQAPGMGEDFYEQSPPAHVALEEAKAIVGPELLDVMFNGPEEALRDTRIAQVALVSSEVAIARHLSAKGLEPAGCAGHSVGEIAALVVAGTLAFGDALRLTRERARLMAEDDSGGSMVAVLGLTPEAIEAALPEGAEVANFNGPQQTIVSGSAEGLAAAADALKEAGAKRVLPLKVSGPFHSTFMKPASEQLHTFLESIEFAPPRVRFVSSVTGKEESDPAAIKDLLWQQLYSPVHWTDVMIAVGGAEAVECGPGKVLQGIAKRIEGGPAVSLAGTLEQADALQ